MGAVIGKPGTPAEQKESRPPGGVAAIVMSPVVWGALLTLGFYALIPYWPLQQELAERYFCSHPLEYATTLLFFVGVSVLILKGGRILRERAAFSRDFLSEQNSAEPSHILDQVDRIEAQLNAQASGVEQTYLVQRLREVCSYVRGCRSSETLEEHLKYLAEIAADRLHASYALVRTITWAVPIIGFLGTVIGITIAIANVTPEQLDTSLGEVTSGLAVAFDTTALALTLSLVLVFGAFLVERSEQQILADVEEFAMKRLTPWFPNTADQGPLAAAQNEAAQRLLERTETLINWQTELWRNSLESLRQRWTETLDVQKHDFDRAIQDGMTATLADHQEQLATVRAQFLQTFQTAADELANHLTVSRTAQQEWQLEMAERFESLWQQMQSGMDRLDERQSERVDRLMRCMTDNVQQWREQLESETNRGSLQLEELQRLGDSLLQVLAEEQQLVKLQDRLASNLEAVRATDAFEETLNSLTAAVHLLAARTKSKAA